MRLALKETRLGLRNSTTRIPFRYGAASLTRCPQAILRVVVESGGRRQAGFSGDCLPPSWFDKSPGKDFARQIDEMLRAIAVAQEVYGQAFADETPFFRGWFSAHLETERQCVVWGAPPLLASFGSSLMERAIVDAACRHHGLSFAEAVRTDLLGIEPGLVHGELQGNRPADWLPARPLTTIFVRQTVGLGDPLTAADVEDGQRVRDGWPQTLEDYVTTRGVRYFKVKVANRLDADVDRLTRIAWLLEQHRGRDYHLTLDGNEQYKQTEEFDALVGAMRSSPAVATLWENVLAIEQPFDRATALSPDCSRAVRALSRSKPVIMDESDGTLDAYRQAIDAGYLGVSSKNCKGALKSLLNAGLTWHANDRGRQSRYLMTGEDLCSVGVVPVQSDLCLAATLGLTHVERNGHHYHPGLSYLPESERLDALAAHADFYTDEHGIIGPRIVDGRLEIGSLQCAGFGFAVEPDIDAMEPAGRWTFASLGL